MFKFVARIAFVAVVLTCATAYPQGVSADESANKTASAKGTDFFEKQIAPILKRRCYKCHSHESGKAKGGLVLDSRHGWKKGGTEGPAIVPGKPAESLLIEAVRYEGYEMPPEEQLPASEIALLEKWVKMGAPDPRESKAAKVAAEKLWALQPITKPAVPTVKDANWLRDDLDAFVLAALENQGLGPGSDADRYTLLRRVTFDLTGLPPTSEEIEAFISDRSIAAYEKVVDRLLESPGFGDHWARHWFDLSCYADLADIQGNVLIQDAWRYRDYVIGAFNSDKPLDRFIHEQIAGDLLPYENVEQQREQIIATGYLAIGPWTLQNYIKGQLAADVVDHQIDRIGRTFLGQTISCARCHDHKFDPIPTADYYALAGIFNSTLTTSYDGPGVWSQITHVTLPELPGSAEEFERLSREIGQQQQKLRARLTELQGHDEKSRFTKKAVNNQANALTLKSGISANDEGREYRVSFVAGPSVWAGAGQATAEQDGLLLQVLRKDETVLAYHVHRPHAWSGKADAQQLNAASFVYTGDDSGDVSLHITSSDYTNRFGGAIDDLSIAESDTSRVVFAEDFDKCQLGSIKAKQAGTGLPVYAKCLIPGWAGGGINHSHVVDIGEPDEPNIALQIFSGPAVGSANPRIAGINRELERLTKRLELARPGRLQAIAVKDIETPRDSPIYRRGDFQSHGDIVPRGFVDAVSVSKNYDISPGTSGRVQLAKWLTDPTNPLTSRVLVNRIWHHLFGKGLVRSVDYFGVHGETPSHPELLDFLAVRFHEQDRWSLKTAVRRMVMSRTYRMASSHNARAAAIDPDNRLLWQMPRRRLTAESIRDAMLTASGQLDPGRGGSSLGLELKGNVAGAGGNVNPPTWAGKIADYIRDRRSVYLPLKRERPVGELEILTAFDFPHPSEITGARANTTVATQALFLLNAPFVKNQANKLAERLTEEEPDDEQARVNRLYLLTVSRPADAKEIEEALSFLDQCTQDLAGSSPDKARSVAWTQLCHAVLGSNSFLFRE
ncbi:MAG: PSD1 and planctomycete cytochrome C domain-containing protein [Pirellulaceae bacterium]